MADRFYINTTNLVTFAAGERPSADKFNAVNKYFSRGLTSLSRIIGDAHDNGVPHNFLNTPAGDSYRKYLTNPWNRSNDEPKNERPLDITNLARLIGPASNLNPKYLYRENPLANREVQETIPSGVNEYYFNFKHSAFRGLEVETPTQSSPTYINSGLPLTDSDATNVKYNVDASNSSIRFNKPLEESIIVKYAIAISDTIEGGPNYVDAEFNVIPDPNEPVNGANRLDIVKEVDGSYTITLPTLLHQQSGLVNLADSNLGPDEPNAGAQLKVPAWMQGLPQEQELPQGTIYLKNRTTGETYIDAVYTLISETEIKVSNVELCLDNAEDYCLISVGTDITTSIDDLRNKTFLHKHDGRFGESRISIYDLKDIFKFAPPSGFYQVSELNWNVIPQYLHRDGWQAGEDLINGENAMRGSLMMALASYDNLDTDNFPASNNDGSGTSEKILFGSEGSEIQKVDGVLSIVNTSTTLGFSNNIHVHCEDFNATTRGYNLNSREEGNLNSEVEVNINIDNVNYLHAEENEILLNEAHSFETEENSGNISNVIPVNTLYVQNGGVAFQKRIENKIDNNRYDAQTIDTEQNAYGVYLGGVGFDETDPEGSLTGASFIQTVGTDYHLVKSESRINHRPNPMYVYHYDGNGVETVGNNQNVNYNRIIDIGFSINKLDGFYHYLLSQTIDLLNSTASKLYVIEDSLQETVIAPGNQDFVFNKINVEINRGINLFFLGYQKAKIYKSTFFVKVESPFHTLNPFGPGRKYALEEFFNLTFDYSSGTNIGITNFSFNEITGGVIEFSDLSYTTTETVSFPNTYSNPIGESPEVILNDTEDLLPLVGDDGYKIKKRPITDTIKLKYNVLYKFEETVFNNKVFLRVTSEEIGSVGEPLLIVNS